MIDPLIMSVICAGLAALFWASALHKLRDHHGFASALRGYVLIPRGGVRGLSWVIPVLELGAGSMAAMRIGGSITLGIWLCVSLLLIYAFAIFANLRAGKVHVDCGCLHFGTRRPMLTSNLILRNLILAAVGALALLDPTTRPLSPADWLSLPLAVSVAALLYSAYETLNAFGWHKERS
jgi:hypothetical protein